MGNQFLNPKDTFYSNLCSPSGIAKHDWRCMQFADYAGNIAAGALI